MKKLVFSLVGEIEIEDTIKHLEALKKMVQP